MPLIRAMTAVEKWAMPADAVYETRLTIDKLERTYAFIREEDFVTGKQ